MKLKDKKIAFGLTSCFYAFKNTIAEMKIIVKEGGRLIPIMTKNAYETDSKYYKADDLKKEIESLSNRKIINTEEEAERVEADIIVIAPCSRKSHCKACIFYI